MSQQTLPLDDEREIWSVSEILDETRWALESAFNDIWVRGEVTSGSFAPSLKKNIARAYLPVGSNKPGTEVEVEVRGKRLRARVVKTPFYRRSR